VADHYLVEQARGPAWDYSKRRREQAGWDAHAVFMDALVEEGVIVLTIESVRPWSVWLRAN
jgi:hypothetical protein